MSGGHTRTISNAYQNPQGDRECWSGDSGGYMQTIVTLPVAPGQNAFIRFRQATDKQNFLPPYTGWRVDSIVVSN